MRDLCECSGFERNCCCENNSQDPCSTIGNIQNDLCDMKANLAEIKANLLNLVRIMCICNGCICDEEQELLLAIERGVNDATSRLAQTRKNINSLNNDIC